MNQKAANPEFWNRRAVGYSKKPVPNEEAYRQTLDRVKAFLRPEHQVLEIGCGTGSTALLVAPAVRTYLGSDLSSAMIAIAREKAGVQRCQNVQFVVGTIDSPELDSNSFDVVMGFNLFHLIADLDSAFARAHRLLKPGGLFISKTPCIGEQGYLLRGAIGVLQALGFAPFVNYFTKASLEETVTSNGFSVVETGDYPQNSRNHFIVARK